jgi:hypothetical protein
MKHLLFTLAFAIIGNASAQWETRRVDNGFDPPYHLAFCYDGGNFLKLENFGEGKVALILYTGYFCNDKPFVEVTYKMDTGWSKYLGEAIMRTSDKKKIILSADIDAIMYDEFRKSSVMKIRVDDKECGKAVYEFNMRGSSYAMWYVKNSPN